MSSNEDEISQDDQLQIMKEVDQQEQSQVPSNCEKNLNLFEAPRVGMIFVTDKLAYDFYNSFAFKEGFSIRKNWNYKARNSEIVTKYHFVCNKEGFKKLDKRLEGKVVKRRRDEREGCKAHMYIERTKGGDWVVNKFSNTHNHELILSPTKKCQLRSHNKAHKNPCIKSLVENIHGCGLGPAQISRLVNVMSDESVMVTPSQVAGQLRVNRKNNIGKECMAVLNKFLERQALDSQFFYAFEIDEDNVCRSIFWADGRARNAYLKFCDVIVFDVTYKTNSFSMPFAPFTGVNHHRQSTLFGCALLADEREETFVWLFKQWLRCMWDKAPSAIITDQDTAIGNAIKRIFPHAHHRYCSWHLSLHEDEHIRSLHSIPEFDDLYTRWAKKSKSIEESEQYWNTLKEKKHSFVGILTEKQRNEMKAWNWLEDMYGKRHHWVKAYLRGTFFAGMKSSQRSESMNAFFDGFVHSTTPLNEFVDQYDKALADRRSKEESEDLVNMRTHPDLTYLSAIESHAGKVYTRNIFNLVAEEFKHVWSCEHKKLRNEGDIATYEVTFTCREKVVSHNVDVNVSNLDFKCSCAKFETWGLLCKHILYIMKQKLFMKSIPDKYILPRWTLGVRYSIAGLGSLTKTNVELIGQPLTPMEIWSFRTSFNNFFDKITSRREYFQIGVDLLQKGFERVSIMEAESVGIIQQHSHVASTINIIEVLENSNIMIRDPTNIRTKGRPKVATRFPFGKVVAQSQSQTRVRTCSVCHEKGHDVRKCPSNKGGSSSTHNDF